MLVIRDEQLRLLEREMEHGFRFRLLELVAGEWARLHHQANDTVRDELVDRSLRDARAHGFLLERDIATFVLIAARHGEQCFRRNDFPFHVILADSGVSASVRALQMQFESERLLREQTDEILPSSV